MGKDDTSREPLLFLFLRFAVVARLFASHRRHRARRVLVRLEARDGSERLGGSLLADVVRRADALPRRRGRIGERRQSQLRRRRAPLAIPPVAGSELLRLSRREPGFEAAPLVLEEERELERRVRVVPNTVGLVGLAVRRVFCRGRLERGDERRSERVAQFRRRRRRRKKIRVFFFRGDAPERFDRALSWRLGASGWREAESPPARTS